MSVCYACVFAPHFSFFRIAPARGGGAQGAVRAVCFLRRVRVCLTALGLSVWPVAVRVLEASSWLRLCVQLQLVRPYYPSQRPCVARVIKSVKKSIQQYDSARKPARSHKHARYTPLSTRSTVLSRKNHKECTADAVAYRHRF